jgi:threonylcarbamoyladenosine tRNA methylthiotransferase MtaB
MTNDIITFGCRLNAYESEVMRGHLAASGRENTLVFNSCAVTEQAEKQLRQAIRKARREKPEATIIVTGCAAQVNPERYQAMTEVDAVLGNAEKLEASSYLALDTEKPRVNDIMSVTETALHLVQGLDGRARAFVQVQNGCNHRCTFCIIPYGRGNSRSVPMGEIVGQVRVLVEQGFKEVVITGVDISAYGADLPGTPTLGQMCRRLLAQVPELPRLRISSLDAVEVDDDLLTLIAEEPRLMPHLHLSLQAGDDMILKRMKRRHLRKDAIDFCAKVKALRPDVVFGADIIAGFPTETEAMFAQSLDLLEACDITYLHAFPYSERPGTPAAKMPPVPKQTRKERAGRLREAASQRLQNYLRTQIGHSADVLVEKETMGRTAHFAEVRLATPAVAGALMQARIVGVEGEMLLAA